MAFHVNNICPFIQVYDGKDIIQVCDGRCDAPKPGGPLTTRQLAEYS